MANMRELSKQEWTGNNNNADINSGSLQRIADGVEKMGLNILSLQNDRDMYKRWYNTECEKTRGLYARIAALKGVITRQKKGLAGK